jgi:hypothetical protein
MTFDETKWKAAYKAAVGEDVGSACKGVYCIKASLRYIRDGLIEQNCRITPELAKAKPQLKDSAEFAEAAIRDGLTELFLSMKDVKVAGFASNASAAAKACGFKSSGETEDFNL